MAWLVEVTDEFDEWWESLDEGARDAVDVIVDMLEELGPGLPERLFDRHLENLKGGT